MSGDISLENEPIIFYSDQMTVSKVIVLKHKGIKFSLYHKILLTIKITASIYLVLRPPYIAKVNQNSLRNTLRISGARAVAIVGRGRRRAPR